MNHEVLTSSFQRTKNSTSKKLLTVLLFPFYFLLFPNLGYTQLALLHKFNDTAGGRPNGPLTKVGKMLYGMTPSGGANGDGCIFSMDSTGKKYKDIFDFNGTNGSNPQDGLIFCNNKLYGTAQHGGAHGVGCVFSIDTSGKGYTDRLDFNGTNGSTPLGNLMFSVNRVYGMTNIGGAHDSGCVFTIDTSGGSYKDLLDFAGPNGAKPKATLILARGLLYGTTNVGGLFHKGCVFSIHANGTSYVKLHDFTNDTLTPAYPIGQLCLSGPMLYGITTSDNNHMILSHSNRDMVFKLDTNGTGFKEIASVNAMPSSLLQVNNLFYFMTGWQPLVDNPGTTLWSVDTAGNTKVLWQFTFKTIRNRDSAGYAGCDYLMSSGNLIYGTNNEGGDANDDGTIYTFQLLSASAAVSGNITCRGSNNGKVTCNATGGNPPYTYLWTPSGATTATMTGASAGTYTVTVTDSVGSVATASVTLTQPTLLTIATHPITNVSCYRGSNGTASATVAGGVPPYTYLWSSGSTASNGTGLIAGTNTIKVTDHGGCSETASVTLTQPTIVSATITKVIPLCNGSSNGSMTATGSGGTPPYASYAWAPYGGTNATATGLSAQTYTVTVTDSKGCNGIALAGLGQPVAITVTVPTFTCVVGGKGTVVANAAGGTPAYHYTWSNGTSTVGTLKTETFLNGSYTVSVTDNHSCPSATASITISGCPTIRMEGMEKPDTSDNGSLANIKVYPNPSKGIFTFDYVRAQNFEPGEIEIYNILGEKVYSSFNIQNPTFNIDLSSKSNGVYFYRVIANNTNILGEGKLVIQK